MGPIIHEYYASTEAIGFVHCDSEAWLAHKGTVGRSLFGPIHVVDDDGARASGGERGHDLLRGGADFEYHNDPEKTAGARDTLGRGWSTSATSGTSTRTASST